MDTQQQPAPSDDTVLVAITDPGEVGRAEQSKGDRTIIHISNVISWLFPTLMIAICCQVILRQLGHNQAWLDDLQWWIYGIVVLAAIAYAVTTNSHVRVDILYDNFDEKKKARTDVFALAWLFLPFILICWDLTFHYAVQSIASDEGSTSPNGLHNLWIMKVALNAAFVLIAFATWFSYVRRLKKLCAGQFWQQLTFALPSVWFFMNLVTYYAVWWVLWFTAEEGTKARAITRHDLFDEIEWGAFETAPAVIWAFIATLILIGVARLLSGRNAQQKDI